MRLLFARPGLCDRGRLLASDCPGPCMKRAVDSLTLEADALRPSIVRRDRGEDGYVNATDFMRHAVSGRFKRGHL